MSKHQNLSLREKTSKKLDDKILLQAELRLSEIRHQQSTPSKKSIFTTFFATPFSVLFSTSRWSLAAAAIFVVLLVLFADNSLNNTSFSKADLNEIADSPIEIYSELQLDLMHDQDLIEQDLHFLADNDDHEI